MEGTKKRPKSGALEADRAVFKMADEEITALVEKYLPPMPHLVSVPTSNPYLREFVFENEHTPFDRNEVQPMQYMTLVSNGDRGVGVARGNWFEEIYHNGSNHGIQMSQSPPDPRSMATTPKHGGARKPATKMSIADYKNLKQSGVRPSPRVGASQTPEMRPKLEGVNGSGKDGMAGTPMGRVPSLEGGLRPTLSGLLKAEAKKGEVRDLKEDRPTSAPTSQPNGKYTAPPSTNGHKPLPRDPPTKNARTPEPAKSTSQLLKPPANHSLPPKPPSPLKYNIGIKSQKRSLEPDQAAPPGKRVKSESRTPSGQKAEPRPAPAETKPSPTKPPKAPTQASPLPRKAPPKTETKPTKTDKPQALPPFLSPLARDLAESIPEQNGFDEVKKSDASKKPSPQTPSKSSNIPSSNSNNAKTEPVKDDNSQSSPLSSLPSSPEHVLPRQLSPGLPDIVEEALARMNEKSKILEKSKVLNTVEARHEKARQPGAPGVAQKTVRPKVGHPPKPPKHNVEKNEEKKSLIVKLPYKKRHAKDIERYLALKPRQTEDFKRLEAERLGGPSASKAAKPVEPEASDSEVDVPLSKLKNTSLSKKRPVEASSAEPSTKRSKPAPNKLDVSKTQQRADTPSFKSPAPNGLSSKAIHNTPKKSIAMRKVDSNDGLPARTPQPTPTSTPASAEKPRINGLPNHTHPTTNLPPADFERLRAEEKSHTQLAAKLKHDMDRLLQCKTHGPDKKASISNADRKLGLVRGIESLVTYMVAFKLSDEVNHASRGRRVPGMQWESMIGLWDFVNRECGEFPVLRAVCAVVGVVHVEIVVRVGVGERSWEKVGSWMERKERLWRVLKGVGEDGVLEGILEGVENANGKGKTGDKRFWITPFTTVEEVKELVWDVLAQWTKAEGLPWKRELA